MSIGLFILYGKLVENASSCDFQTIAGPTPMDKRPIGGAKRIQNKRKVARRLKKLYLNKES